MLFYKYINLKDFIQKNFTLQGISKEISLFKFIFSLEKFPVLKSSAVFLWAK